MTRIEGHDNKSIKITTDKSQKIIYCENAIVRLLFSAGTTLGIRYGSKLYPGVWKIRVIQEPLGAWQLHSVYNVSDGLSDIFEVDEDLVHYEVIPLSFYEG